ncbi:MAG: NUDIX hydrolase, partial [Bacteroidota bacterium]
NKMKINSKNIIIHSKKLLHKSIFEVFETKFKFKKINNTWSDDITHYTVEKGPAVAILVYNTTTEEIILVKQLRTATGKYSIEIPAGIMDPGETPEMSAIRELNEEVGYAVKQLSPVYSFYTTPGIFNELIHFFYAEVDSSMKVSEGGGIANENEDIEVIRVKAVELKEWMQQQKGLDSKTILALQHFQLIQNQNKSIGIEP